MSKRPGKQTYANQDNARRVQKKLPMDLSDDEEMPAQRGGNNNILKYSEIEDDSNNHTQMHLVPQSAPTSDHGTVMTRARISNLRTEAESQGSKYPTGSSYAPSHRSHQAVVNSRK